MYTHTTVFHNCANPVHVDTRLKPAKCMRKILRLSVESFDATRLIVLTLEAFLQTKAKCN